MLCISNLASNQPYPTRTGVPIQASYSHYPTESGFLYALNLPLKSYSNEGPTRSNIEGLIAGITTVVLIGLAILLTLIINPRQLLSEDDRNNLRREHQQQIPTLRCKWTFSTQDLKGQHRLLIQTPK